MTSGPVIVDTSAAALAVERTPATVREWAARGLLEQVGTDERGRRLYKLADVYRVAQLHPPRTPRRK